MPKIQEEGGICPSFFLLMISKQEVTAIVEDFLKSSDRYPVTIEIQPDNAIRVEIDSDQSVSIDDCIALSSYIESRLDREKEDYALEVGSAGIDQAFKTRRQYRKHIGNEVEVLTLSGIKYIGILKAVNEDTIVLTVRKQIKPLGTKRKVTIEEDWTFLYEDIKQAKYNFKL